MQLHPGAGLRGCLRRFGADRRGGVAMIFGLAIIPLFAAIGLAVDAGRGVMVRSKLSNAIDSAGLAGGAPSSRTIARTTS